MGTRPPRLAATAKFADHKPKMAYDHGTIEPKWQRIWRERKTFRAVNGTGMPKYYVLDMFPYPSGAGLHVGHPLGYIASDIVARHKRHSGFNVLHPMGYDSFGLPAEQYAIQTGQHPAKTTAENAARYREQLDRIGFSFDWDREVRTSDPGFYKWTQWIFIQLFNSWYDPRAGKARPISELTARFAMQGCRGQDASVLTGDVEDYIGEFSAEEWNAFDERTRQMVLQRFRLAYLSDAWVNWCPALGTVLANDEVKDGVSERGGHRVERKRMPQWSLRITAYAQRLLDGLEPLDWPASLKEAQRNWIGKSTGASVRFRLAPVPANPGLENEAIEVFTTRPDTLFGVSFLALAPEHPLVGKLTTPGRKAEVEAYVKSSINRSERERQADVERITGVFTGSHAVHPFTGEAVPVWVGDYVLAGYGTGAVMAVPGGDQRDWRFAKHFGLPIIAVTQGADVDKGADDSKDGVISSEGFLQGLRVPEAIERAIAELERLGAGEGKVNFRLRDAAFGRQRYWGEPIPIYYKDDIPHSLPESELPLVLPEVDKFLPTETGEPPLARAKDWTFQGYPLETTTMPGWAGSSWYFLRYMDPHNTERPASKEAIDYWGQVDLYIGGSEHSTGHLLYFRFWTKFLYDLGLVPFDEPAKKLVNQGMIQGISMMTRVVAEHDDGREHYRMIDHGDDQPGSFERNYLIHHVTMRDGKYYVDQAGAEATRQEPTFRDFHLAAPAVEVRPMVEKMSKSKFNVVNPDSIIAKYGADTLRLYEMFLGPLEQSKPWDTHGIEGTYRFLKKFWNLFHDRNGNFAANDGAPTPAELKVLHGTLKKVTGDIGKMSFNTAVSQFMIAVNELQSLKCDKLAILGPLTIALAPFAPHIAEELWSLMGHEESIATAPWPQWEAKYLEEDSFTYPVSINGKVRVQLALPLALGPKELEEAVLANTKVQQRLEGRIPKKVIVVPKRIVNIVL